VNRGRRRYLLRLAIVLVVLAPGLANAGMMSLCTTPGMFPDSDVTVFVFPYVDYTNPESSHIESPVGTELAGLIQADTLLAISRFGHVAAIRMLGRPSECQPASVLQNLMGQFGGGRQQRAIVMVWGRIFPTGGEVYIQSYASFRRFVPADPGEMVQLPLGNGVLAAQLATQTLSFAPAHVNEDDLRQIRERFAKENIVHEKPDEQSPGKPLLLLFPNDQRPAYYMTDTQGDWIRIHTQTGQDGWILARAMLGQQTLSERLPEMKFVEGVAGYFGFRAQPAASKAELADNAFRTFEEAALSPTVPTAMAVSKELRGMLQLLAQNQSQAAFGNATSLFAEAVRVLPASSAARNLASVAWVYREWREPSRMLNFQDTVDKFWSSISANPHDDTALTNCWTLFRIARDPQFRSRFTFEPALSDEELAQEAQRIEDVELGGNHVKLAHADPVVPWPKP
jgi:hypothetical protein